MRTRELERRPRKAVTRWEEARLSILVGEIPASFEEAHFREVSIEALEVVRAWRRREFRQRRSLSR